MRQIKAKAVHRLTQMGIVCPSFWVQIFYSFAFICENLCPSVDHKAYPELRFVIPTQGMGTRGVVH